jgi:hypothetical protein
VGVTAAITKAVVDAQGDVDSGRLTSLGGDYCIHMLVSVPETQEQAFRKEAQAAVGKFGGTHTQRIVVCICVRWCVCVSCVCVSGGLSDDGDDVQIGTCRYERTRRERQWVPACASAWWR